MSKNPGTCTKECRLGSIYTVNCHVVGGERQSKVSKNTTQWPGQCSNQDYLIRSPEHASIRSPVILLLTTVAYNFLGQISDLSWTGSLFCVLSILRVTVTMYLHNEKSNKSTKLAKPDWASEYSLWHTPVAIKTLQKVLSISGLVCMHNVWKHVT